MDNITIKYDAVLSICDEIAKVIRDLNNQVEQVNKITNSKNFWKGVAANKFSTEVRKKYDDVSEMTNKIIPTYIEQVKTIVEYNKKTDGQINATDIISANSIVKISTGTAVISRIAQIKSGGTVDKKISSKTTTSTGTKNASQVESSKVKTTTSTSTSNNTNTDIKKSSEIGTDTKTNDNVKSNTDNSKNNVNQVESDKVKTTTSASTSNNTTSNTGAISLSELLKFINK